MHWQDVRIVKKKEANNISRNSHSGGAEGSYAQSTESASSAPDIANKTYREYIDVLLLSRGRSKPKDQHIFSVF